MAFPVVHQPSEWLLVRRLPAKRAIDIAGAAVLLLLSSPVMLAVCLLLWATCPGPVLFRQIRAGRQGKPFCMLKFRTMHPGAHAARAVLAAHNESDGHLFKLRHDPRVTRVGRHLRRLSLDELPQLVNVLRGDMSLVGPRPLLLEDSDYTGRARNRLLVSPGITGLWQVRGRSNLPWEEMLRLDLHYVENLSLRLDAGILLRTVPAVLTGRGAH